MSKPKVVWTTCFVFFFHMCVLCPGPISLYEENAAMISQKMKEVEEERQKREIMENEVSKAGALGIAMRCSIWKPRKKPALAGEVGSS